MAQASSTASPPAPVSDWWMFHGDPAHSGLVTGSSITSANVGTLATLWDVELDGPILSTPAVVAGFVYVGTANSHEAVGSNGGSFYKVELETGAITAVFHWDIPAEERDTHGFCGMGCTPCVTGGRVYWSAFNGKIYCLDQATLKLLWVTDLRYADALHNQPVTNDLGAEQGLAPAAGWSSPVVANGKLYVGFGEGENPFLYSFVYCLDAASGDVVWIFCTCQFQANQANQPNQLPAATLSGPPPAGFTVFDGQPVTKGCSVWAGIAYDETLNRLYCSTGNPVILVDGSPSDSPLPSPGTSNGLLVLAADTGMFINFVQFPPQSSYRVTDIDVDVGGAPTLWTDAQGHRRVGLGCKNGSYMVLDAQTLVPLALRQMLPSYQNGGQIATVDPHGTSDETNDNEMNPRVPNEVSNANQGENYSGTYSTAAIHPGTGRLFVGLGGNNYHPLAPGIDTETTPFMRALSWDDLSDAWPLDDNDPQRYQKARPPMYTNATESGLSVPAVVNDVVFMATTMITVYAFSVADGTPLWQDQLGEETGGDNGGYGYCMGPAVWGDYVVAGALVYGRNGGLLRIYGLPQS